MPPLRPSLGLEWPESNSSSYLKWRHEDSHIPAAYPCDSSGPRQSHAPSLLCGVAVDCRFLAIDEGQSECRSHMIPAKAGIHFAGRRALCYDFGATQFFGLSSYVFINIAGFKFISSLFSATSWDHPFCHSICPLFSSISWDHPIVFFRTPLFNFQLSAIFSMG